MTGGRSLLTGFALKASLLLMSMSSSLLAAGSAKQGKQERPATWCSTYDKTMHVPKSVSAHVLYTNSKDL